MKRTLLTAAILGVLLTACDTGEETAQTEKALEPEELMHSKELPPGERLRPEERDVLVLESVKVDEEALADAPALQSEIGPKGTQLDVLKADADADRLIVQIRVENLGETPAAFRLDLDRVLARTPDLTLMMPAQGGAADSSSELTRDPLTVSVEPGESEILSFQFAVPEEEITQFDLYLPDTDPIEGVAINWTESAQSADDAQTADAAESEEASDATG